MTPLAQVLDQQGQEVIVEDGFKFIEEAVLKAVDGDRTVCLKCGGDKDNPNDFICRECFKQANKAEAGRGVYMARAAINAFVKAGGVVEHQRSRQEAMMISKDLFSEIVGACKEWCKKNPDTTVQQAIEYLLFVFNDVDHGAVGKAGATAHRIYNQHQTLWNNAVNIVARWYEKNPNDFRNPSEVGRAIMAKLKPEAGEKKVVAAVYQYQSSDEFQVRKKSWLFQRCEGIAGSYLGKTFDNRHPGEIAQEIIDNRKKGDPLPQSILPMLTRAVANLQNELRQAERERLIASHDGGQKVKKPGSVSTRHKNHDHNGHQANKGGGKKRRVKA